MYREKEKERDTHINQKRDMELLYGPSLAFLIVIIWAKFVFKTLFVENTIK